MVLEASMARPDSSQVCDLRSIGLSDRVAFGAGSPGRPQLVTGRDARRDEERSGYQRDGTNRKTVPDARPPDPWPGPRRPIGRPARPAPPARKGGVTWKLGREAGSN